MREPLIKHRSIFRWNCYKNGKLMKTKNGRSYASAHRRYNGQPLLPTPYRKHLLKYVSSIV